jgi:PleD family two-component response regulator
MVLGGISATEPDLHMLIAQADRGMYLSKQGGRNQVTVQRSAA